MAGTPFRGRVSSYSLIYFSFSLSLDHDHTLGRGGFFCTYRFYHITKQRNWRGGGGRRGEGSGQEWGIMWSNVDDGDESPRNFGVEKAGTLMYSRIHT